MSTRSPDDIKPPSGEYPVGSSSPALDPHADRTVAALVSATDDLVASTSELHAALCEYVQHLKASGEPAERVVILVKAAIVQAGLEKAPHTADVLVDAVISECIKEFYTYR
jgi:hypothetical protein